MKHNLRLLAAILVAFMSTFAMAQTFSADRRRSIRKGHLTP
jgi:hypothetical protein